MNGPSDAFIEKAHRLLRHFTPPRARSHPSFVLHRSVRRALPGVRENRGAGAACIIPSSS